MSKITVINGPNLNLLHIRDKSKYGNYSLLEIEKLLKDSFLQIEFDFYQSNIEGEIVEKVQSSINNSDCIIINPGGYAHTSVAIRDALHLFNGFKVEVHLSHLALRENYRQTLITATACNGYISGFAEKSYLAAVELCKLHLEEKN